MKILLDNCIDSRAKPLFPGHEVVHARDLGWRALENGKLLAAAAESGFGVMVTVDKNIRHQQNLEALPVSILELDLPRSRLKDIQAVSFMLAEAISKSEAFRLVSLKSDGSMELLAPRAPAQ